MTGTEATLFDAFMQADQQGLEGSPLERALGVFSNNDPRPSPFQIGQTPAGGEAPRQTNPFTGQPQQNPFGPQSTPQPTTQIGQPEQDSPGIFDRVMDVADPVLRGSSFLDTVLPGEPGTAIKEGIADIPVVGGFTSEALDNVLSPASFLVAARGIQAANALRNVPVVGKFAGALVEPITTTGNFGARFGVEGSAIIGGTALGMLTEDAPFPVQLAASLGGALLGARQGLKIFGDVNQPGQAVKAVTQKLHPTGTIAEVARLDGALTDLQANELAGLDELARRSRGALMAEGELGNSVFAMPDNAVELADNHWSIISSRELSEAQQLPSLMTQRIANTRPVEGLMGYIAGMGRYGKQVARIFNGNVGRNPAGRAVSEVSYDYASTGVVNASNAEALVKLELDESFGPQLEKIAVKDALGLDDVDTRRLAALEKNAAELDEMLTATRSRTATAGDYDDTWELWGRENDLMARRKAVHNEIDRLKSDAYESPEDALEALADARRFLRQYRDGMVNAASGQDLATHSELMTFIAENQSLFDLSDAQKAFFDNYGAFTDVDLSLNRAFGIDIDEPIDGYYVHHASDWRELTPEGELREVGRNRLAKTLADASLGSRRSFQFPRTFKNVRQWMKTLESVRNPAEWNAKLDEWIDRARTLEDMDEVARLEGLKSTQLVPIPRQQNFAATVAGRMAESYKARAEHLAKNVADEFGPDVRAEVDDLLVNSAVSDLVRKPAEAAGFLRSLLLRADLSMVGVQGMSGSAMMSGPNAGTREFVSTMRRTMASDEEFAKWWLLNSDKLSRWSMRGMTFAPEEINVVTQGLDADLGTKILTGGRRAQEVVLDPDTGEEVLMAGGRVRTAGKDVLPFGRFVKTLDKLQFARGITMMKAYTAEHMLGVFKTAREDDAFFDMAKQGFPNLAASRKELAAMSDEQMENLISGFVNDIYGGRNRVVLGRTQAHQMLESLFMLTPGFTRGTLNVAVNTLKRGPQGALARDYAMRSLMLAGGLVTLLANAFNGIEFEDGKMSFNPIMPNLFDPSRDDWMDIPFPGGRTIRPMSRFRSLGRQVAGSLQEAAINGNWENATEYWTDDSLRWFSYRQSALISSLAGDPIGETFGEQRGNSFVRNLGLKDLLLNPSTNRGADVRDYFVSHGLPIIGQTVAEQFQQAAEAGEISPGQFRNLGIAAGSELFGVSQFGPSMLEQNVTSRTAELAIGHGMDADTAMDLADRGRSALWARDDQDRYLLGQDARDEIISSLAQEFDISEELAARGGARSERERQIVAEEVKKSQLGRFLTALDDADEEYQNRLSLLEDAMSNGAITPQQFSEELTKLRIRKAGARWGAERAAPAAIIFLEDEERKGSQTASEQIMDAISSEAFAEDFYDPDTGTFDAEAREEHFSNLEAKYGEYFHRWQANRDRKKSPLELARDQAFRKLGPYFDVGDQAWQMVTGGALGESERDFDRQLNQMLLSQDIPQQYLPLARSAIKQQIPVLSEYRELSGSLRDMMRAMDPEVDEAAQTWLGALPIWAN